MIRTYTVYYYGSEDSIRRATRIADRVFRQCYSVYGGKRGYSRKGICRMYYTACWNDSGLCRYSWADVFSLIEEKLLRAGYHIYYGKGIIRVEGA